MLYPPMWSDTSWLVRPRGKARSQLEQNVLPSLLYLAWLRALETDNFLCCEGCHVWCHRHWTFSSPDPDNLCSLRFCMCWLSLCFCTFHYVYAFLSWSPLLGLVFQFFEVVWSLACSMGDFTFTLYMLIKFHVDLVWSYDHMDGQVQFEFRVVKWGATPGCSSRRTSQRLWWI